MARFGIWRLLCLLMLVTSAAACARRELHVPEPRQIILVSLDTLRADHLGPWRPDSTSWAASPHLDAFARESVVFRNTLTAATSTTRSHKSIFYGLYNHTHRTSMLSHPVEERVTAPVEVLRRSGLQTTAIACLGAMNDEVGMTHGFDEVEWRRCMYQQSGNDLPTLRQKSFPWLADHAQGEFFLFLHTYQTHTPYHPDDEMLRRVGERRGLLEDWPPPENVLNRASRHWQKEVASPQVMRVMRALYEADVEMADRWFGKLIRQLRRLGIYESAVVIVLADHGESLGENGYVGHSQMADEQAFVPLMMKVPGAQPRVVSDPVSLVDVMPTLFDLLELEPPFAFEGESLVPLLSGRSRLPADRLRIVEHDTRVSLYRGPWKLQFDRRREDTETLTRWTADAAAPQAGSDGDQESMKRDLLRMYAARLKQSQALADKFVLDPSAPADFSDDTLDELRALGYIN